MKSFIIAAITFFSFLSPSNAFQRIARMNCKVGGTVATIDVMLAVPELGRISGLANANQAFNLKSAQSLKVESPFLDFQDNEYMNEWPNSSAAIRVYAYTLEHPCQEQVRTISNDEIVDLTCDPGSDVRELFPNWNAQLGTYNDCGEVSLPLKKYWAKPH